MSSKSLSSGSGKNSLPNINLEQILVKIKTCSDTYSYIKIILESSITEHYQIQRFLTENCEEKNSGPLQTLSEFMVAYLTANLDDYTRISEKLKLLAIHFDLSLEDINRIILLRGKILHNRAFKIDNSFLNEIENIKALPWKGETYFIVARWAEINSFHQSATDFYLQAAKYFSACLMYKKSFKAHFNALVCMERETQKDLWGELNLTLAKKALRLRDWAMVAISLVNYSREHQTLGLHEKALNISKRALSFAKRDWGHLNFYLAVCHHIDLLLDLQLERDLPIYIEIIRKSSHPTARGAFQKVVEKHQRQDLFERFEFIFSEQSESQHVPVDFNIRFIEDKNKRAKLGSREQGVIQSLTHQPLSKINLIHLTESIPQQNKIENKEIFENRLKVALSKIRKIHPDLIFLNEKSEYEIRWRQPESFHINFQVLNANQPTKKLLMNHDNNANLFNEISSLIHSRFLSDEQKINYLFKGIEICLLEKSIHLANFYLGHGEKLLNKITKRSESYLNLIQRFEYFRTLVSEIYRRQSPRNGQSEGSQGPTLLESKLIQFLSKKSATKNELLELLYPTHRVDYEKAVSRLKNLIFRLRKSGINILYLNGQYRLS